MTTISHSNSPSGTNKVYINILNDLGIVTEDTQRLLLRCLVQAEKAQLKSLPDLQDLLKVYNSLSWCLKDMAGEIRAAAIDYSGVVMNFAKSQELDVHIKDEYLNEWRQNESIKVSYAEHLPEQFRRLALKISVLSEAVRNEAQPGSVSSRAFSSINRLVRDIGSRLGLRSESVNEKPKSTFSPTINIRRCLLPFMCIIPYPTEKPIHSHQLPTLAIADDLAVIAQIIAEKIVPRCEVFGNIYRSVLKEIESVDLLTTRDCSTRQANVSDPVGSLREDLERCAANMEWFQKSAHFTPFFHVPS